MLMMASVGLMIVGASHQVPAARHLTLARSLGYRRTEAWLKIVLPQLYRQIRLPIFAVLAFSLSVVDVALIVGPGNPPPLAVLAVRWFADADIRYYFPASAAACLQLLLVVAAIAFWRVAERIAVAAGRAWIARGRRAGAATFAAGVAFAHSLRARSRSSTWRCGRSPRSGAFRRSCPTPGRSPIGSVSSRASRSLLRRRSPWLPPPRCWKHDEQ